MGKLLFLNKRTAEERGNTTSKKQLDDVTNIEPVNDGFVKFVRKNDPL
jgi:hypothetical protein